MLCTSRPAGINEARFAVWRRLELAPLTDAQQREALASRLGSADAAQELMAYVEASLPVDTGTGHRVISNPCASRDPTPRPGSGALARADGRAELLPPPKHSAG